MPAPSVPASQTFAYAGTATESHFSSNSYFSTIVVENATNVSVAVATDGGTAAGGASTHELTVPPDSTMAFGNFQALPNADVPGTNYSSGAGVGWTAQKGWQGTSLTYASVIPLASATGEVTVSFR